jgi:hypothetical protein
MKQLTILYGIMAAVDELIKEVQFPGAVYHGWATELNILKNKAFNQARSPESDKKLQDRFDNLKKFILRVWEAKVPDAMFIAAAWKLFKIQADDLEKRKFSKKIPLELTIILGCLESFQGIAPTFQITEEDLFNDSVLELSYELRSFI